MKVIVNYVDVGGLATSKAEKYTETAHKNLVDRFEELRLSINIVTVPVRNGLTRLEVLNI